MRPEGQAPAGPASGMTAGQTTSGPASSCDESGERQAHILVVDDDERIRTLLRRYLVRQGFCVTGARDAAHARRLMTGLAFDLIVLDVMMPEEDGYSFTRALREAGEVVPIILLTARSETGDRIAGLESGADDYLTKPFEPRELMLRIAAILRRSQPAAIAVGPSILHLGRVRYDVARGALWQGDLPVRLTATEAALMRIFGSEPGVTLSREALVDRMGRDRGGPAAVQAQERAVDVQITRLRRKIEADPRQPRYLQTVRGEGYILIPD